MTLVLEPENETDYRLFVELAKRLRVAYREESESTLFSTAEEQFLNLAGSWEGAGTTDDLIHQIESARTSKDIDISF